jgi:hypothetical protein
MTEWEKIVSHMRNNKNQNQKWNKLADSFIDISYDNASRIKNYKHAAHGFIFAINNSKLWENFNQRAAILMQMR